MPFTSTKWCKNRWCCRDLPSSQRTSRKTPGRRRKSNQWPRWPGTYQTKDIQSTWRFPKIVVLQNPWDFHGIFHTINIYKPIVPWGIPMTSWKAQLGNWGSNDHQHGSIAQRVFGASLFLVDPWPQFQCQHQSNALELIELIELIWSGDRSAILHIGVSIKVPQARWMDGLFHGKSQSKKDDNYGKTPILGNHHIVSSTFTHVHISSLDMNVFDMYAIYLYICFTVVCDVCISCSCHIFHVSMSSALHVYVILTFDIISQYIIYTYIVYIKSTFIYSISECQNIMKYTHLCASI